MNPDYPLWLIGYDIVGLAVGAWVLFGALGKPGVLLDLLRFLVLGAALWGAGNLCSEWASYPDNLFLTLRFYCHGLFCVLVPLMLARGVHHGLLRPEAGGVLAFGIVLLVAGLGLEGTYLWARHVEPHRLEITHHTVRSDLLRGNDRSIRVVVLADLQTDHIGDFERRVFNMIDQQMPDVILVPGDLLQTFDDAQYEVERKKLVELFNGLEHKPPLGIYAVDGDTDGLGGAKRALAGTNVRYLRDELVRCPGKSRLQILGLSPDDDPGRELDDDHLRAINGFHGLTIVMCHRPEIFLSVTKTGISFPAVFVAGHTHGGQVNLPFYGPPVTLSRVSREVAAGGFWKRGDSWLALSRGIGMERGYAPRIRFNCRPELMVLELEPE